MDFQKKIQDSVLEKVNKTQENLNSTENATLIDYASEWLKFANDISKDIFKQMQEQATTKKKEEKKGDDVLVNPQVTNIQIFFSNNLTYNEQVTIGSGQAQSLFAIKSDLLDFNKLEELKSQRTKPDFMTDEEWIEYQKDEDEWIYKMQKIALDAEERQQSLQNERDQKRNEFQNKLKRKAIEIKRKEDAQKLKE